MPPLKLFILFQFLKLLSYQFSLTAATIPTYVFHFCSNTTFVRNSTYGSNLNLLLSSLSANATTSSAGFLNTTVGQDPDMVSGHFLCRGDQNTSSCQNCVTFATRNVTRGCPHAKEAILWFNECLLRYSNKSLFSVMETLPSVAMSSENNNSTEPVSRFNEMVGTLMNEAATQAVNNDPDKFATRRANFTAFQTLYGLVQCTPDLSSSDCGTCLRGAILELPKCCSAKQGGRVLSPSCNIRYESQPFYNESATARPPQQQSPPPPAPFTAATRSRGKSGVSSTIIAIAAPTAISIVLVIVGLCFLRRRAKKKYNDVSEENTGNDITTPESLQFDFKTIEAATNNFSIDNKLGEGGFGQVYKGVLPNNGQEIAVKRLSRSSGQGAQEFRNEVRLLAKLQHRNLVRLLGFCLEGEEKILVYEFVPNKSLDYFLFDSGKQGQLEWSIRYKIIGGIAKGILYLHEDSRIRIIHRDLKASNILLDADMNPKVSDFGLARMFEVDQTQGETSKIAGTYGYMSPEYGLHGNFSVKSDVYSFGVLVLEIITGKKNSSFYRADGAENLLSYAWKHWRDGKGLQLLNADLRNSCPKDEVIRCIHMGLLCVQEDPAERPSMATILLMLSSSTFIHPLPHQPAFFINDSSSSPGEEKGLLLPTTEFVCVDKSASKSITTRSVEKA